MTITKKVDFAGENIVIQKTHKQTNKTHKQTKHINKQTNI